MAINLQRKNIPDRIATFVVLVIAGKSLREEDSFPLFPRLGLGLTLLDMVCWIGTYTWGFLS